VKVLTWNIWAKGAENNPSYWQDIAQFLKEADPDLIALQEVDRFWSSRSQNLDVSKEIANMIGYNYYFSPSINLNQKQYGNAILSKSKILKAKNSLLSPEINWDKDNHDTEPRSAAIVVVKDPRPTVFISTHLANAMYLQSTKITSLQANKIINIVQEARYEYPNHALILAGDFNLEPDRSEIKKIDQVISRQGPLLPTWPSQPFSYHGWEENPPPRFSIDHIFSNISLKTKTAPVYISDHLPLIGYE